jgi:aspartate/methionine/tyrosine aminotransferase
MKELLDMSDENSLGLWNGLKLGYTESQGNPVLREEVSRLYKTITPENVLITSPEEGIYIAMNNILSKGDHVIATFPGYQSLYEIANSLGCEVSPWAPKEDKGWTFDTDDLQDLIRDHTKLIVINFPHNPTGATIPQSGLEKIIEIAKQKNIILFSDEMYRFLEYDESDRTSSACDLYDNAVSLFGMSKSFALAGLRIGWLTTRNNSLFRQFASYKDYTTLCSSAPSEILAVIALRAKERILRRNLDMIKSNLIRIDDFFVEHAELFEWHKPKAGPIGFPKLKGDKKAADFCLDLVEKKGVMLLPADQYDFEGNNFRIGFARKNMPEALTKLEEYITEAWS